MAAIGNVIPIIGVQANCPWKIGPYRLVMTLMWLSVSLNWVAADGVPAFSWLIYLMCPKAPRLKKDDGQVDWSRSAVQIRNQVRGLKPWPGTFIHWNRGGRQPMRLILDQVSLVSDSSQAEPGSVVKSDGSQLWVATGDGTLAIDRLQPAGKRLMDVGEFLRGHPIETGTRFAS